MWDNTPVKVTRIEWARLTNKTFHDFVDRFLVKRESNERLQTLYEAYVAMSLARSDDTHPFSGLSTSPGSVHGVFSGTSHPFCTMDRCIEVDGTNFGAQSDLVDVRHSFFNINTDVYTPSTFWSVATWCYSTKTYLSKRDAPLDLSQSMTSHLHTFGVTMASLLRARVGDERGGECPLEDVLGIIGPMVDSGEGQTMRIVSFTRHHAQEHTDYTFVVLIPEAFVRLIFSDLNYDMDDVRTGGPFLFGEGVVVLPEEYEVKLDGNCTTGSSDSVGLRMWELPTRLACTSVFPFTPRKSSVMDDIISYKDLPSFRQTSEYTMLHTRFTDRDSLCGLHVRLAALNEMNRVTLVTDSCTVHSVCTETPQTF